MLVSLHVIGELIHFKPLTVLTFLIIGCMAVCLWSVGITFMTVGVLIWKNAAARSRTVRNILRVVIAGFIAFVILAPIVDSKAQTAPVCRTLAECNTAVPLVPGTTAADAAKGQDMIERGMRMPLRPAPGSTNNNPVMVVDHHATWRT